MVDMVGINSSNLVAVGYEPVPAARLYVRFKSGQTYLYENVPPNVYEELISAASAGQYFNTSIKGRYGHSMV